MKIIHDLFTPDECKKIIDDRDVDFTYIFGTPVGQGDWIPERLGNGYIPSIIKYKTGQERLRHNDTIAGVEGETIIVFLNDDYEGGEFYMFIDGVKTLINRVVGSAVTYKGGDHMVSEVTKGVRYVLAAWRE